MSVVNSQRNSAPAPVYRLIELETALIEQPDFSSEGHPDEVVQACELYLDGLEPALGGLQRVTIISRDPAKAFLSEVGTDQKIKRFKRDGIPVFFGPGAMLKDTILAIRCSESDMLMSTGIWIPRTGSQRDPATLTHVRVDR